MSTKIRRAEKSLEAPKKLGPGFAIRAARQKKGWTLVNLSRETGLPVSTLSKIETNKISLSYEKIICICTALNIAVTELVGPSDEQGHRTNGWRSITRAGEEKTVESKNALHFYPAAELAAKRFVPEITELRVRSVGEFGAFLAHQGEVYLYVLEGVVELHSEYYAPLLLRQGDSIYFDGEIPHAYVAASADRCRLLRICSRNVSSTMRIS